MIDTYILDGHKPIPCDDIDKWGNFLKQQEKRIVKQDYVGKIFVSTVFLGLDHNFGKKGTPILFETMIFTKDKAGYYQERYSTWEEAEEGHKKAIEIARRMK